MCSDVEVLGGKVADCSGQCMNGGVCMTVEGESQCVCRKGFEGNFCQIVTYVPDKTNYTKYLKYFLFFIIMILIIIGLLVGGWMLFNHADAIKSKLSDMMPKREVQIDDPDALSGRGFAEGQSVYGQNAHLAN